MTDLTPTERAELEARVAAKEHVRRERGITPWKVRTRFGSYTAEGYDFWWCFWRTLLVLACIAAYFGAIAFAMVQR